MKQYEVIARKLDTPHHIAHLAINTSDSIMTKQHFLTFDSETNELNCHGEWVIANLDTIKKTFHKISWPQAGKITINGHDISRMDSAGAFFLIKWVSKLSEKKLKIHLENFSEQQKKLLDSAEEQQKIKKDLPQVKELNWLQQLGKYSLEQVQEAYEFINFIGKLFFEVMQIIFNPLLWRWNTFASIINKAGTKAVPIITLLSFMIGIVITYQMGNELKKYGANIFVVNLVGFSILREFGPLLTAIMVTGRTGSAFTAQLGLMKINQEIDAINTMGITPENLLLLPRLIALFIVLPLLTIWADIFGVIGGMLMAQHLLGVMPHEFLIRFEHEIPLRALLIGLGKAPIFALIIASISCFQGMAVRGSSESVGERTTRSVVLTIFLIIVIDGIISILLSYFKL